jgi:phosphatidylserine/phosphatidylglycerophosphate/cardiolipin synthase-like enzyme
MYQKFRSRKALLFSFLGVLLCVFLPAFVSGPLDAIAHTGTRVTSTVGSTFQSQSSRHSLTLRTAHSSLKTLVAHPAYPIVPFPSIDTSPTSGTTPTPDPSPTVDVSPTVGTTPTSTPVTTPTATGTPGTGTQSISVFVEPAAGEQVILDAINNAQQSVWLEDYILSDTNVITALENAAKRGLDVRVMLDPHPYGGSSPQATLAALNAAGAKAQISNPAFTYTHEKTFVFDGSTAYIMTCNMSYSALNGKNREYGAIDTTPQDVQGAINIFNADWNRTADTVNDSNLVISPDNSRNQFLSVINNAQTSLIIEAEEMQDSAVEQAIASAAQRGVMVQVILPTPSGSSDSNASGIATIKAGGAQVEEDSQLYMHAKMIVADGTLAYVGSVNISTNSFNNNRELGVLFTDGPSISTLQQTFQSDWSVSQGV